MRVVVNGIEAQNAPALEKFVVTITAYDEAVLDNPASYVGSMLGKCIESGQLEPARITALPSYVRDHLATELFSAAQVTE